ncbi:MAG TPA: D-glycero-beta-D-manno-heptose 1-phosphate adenylyltransferase [Caulobacteraceae bacterium]|jgi:D-beta-D-heptose 7-phosphate kinase/D-beta-D-heptose 1-phosphate adenosyltransferase
MDMIALQKLLSAMSGAKVVAVGDLMVDRFIYGEVSRISAEAPVPILVRSRESVMLGAAGNVARNVAALGGAAALIGIVGEDLAAEEARFLIGAEAGVTGELIVEPDRPTTTKMRFASAGQQLLRVDHEAVAPASEGRDQAVCAAITRMAKGAGAILLSDYGKGVVSETVIASCLAAAKANGAPLIVDSKARAFRRYRAADVIKPNAAELAFATDLPTTTDGEIEAALAKALKVCRCRAILVTRAARGMSLAVRGEPVRHFRRPPPEVFDTAGAGDTALAALGLALASGAALDEAVELALLASSVVVEKAGVAVVSPDELLEAELAAHRAPTEAKIVTLEGMERAIARWRERGLKVGFTNGCFDILHPGHIAYLGQAKSWCDRLVVGLNSDASVRRAKGEGRPVNSLEARALVLASLACVDLVTAFDEDTPAELIAAARPDLLVKGGDYAIGDIVGADLVQTWGGEVRIAAFVDGHSTTATLAKAARR